MDKLKEFLRQAIKYRFWIVVGVAALLPIIAYFVASGSVKAETEAATGTATAALNDVKKYQSGLVPSPAYKDEADKRTEVLKGDIDQAWRLLYNRQAPLLTWPEEVAGMFATWGKQWPEGYDDAAVRSVVNDYIQLYPAQVDATYDALRPFDYEDGTGIVVAPVKEALLRPATFSLEAPPTLGKVWGAQQKLWIQRTVLDVINDVNRDAKDWDAAPIKEITGLEVANQLAQDQKSIVKGELLEPAPEIVKPGSAAASSAASTAASSSPEGRMTSAMMSPGIGGSSGSAGSEPETVNIFKKASPNQPFEVIPVFVSVLIDQRRVLDLIAAFEASPMEIQVVDFELSRPTKSVVKPEKGEQNPSFMYGNMSSGIAGGGIYGGMMSSESFGYGRGGRDMTSAMYGGMRPPGMMGSGMMSYGGMGGETAAKKSGTDITADQVKKLEERKKKKDEKADDAKKSGGRGGYTDPYFDVVEVKIYGHARFYNPPPAEKPKAESASPGDAAAPADAEAPAADAPKTDDAKPADAAAKPADADAKPADAAAKPADADAKPADAEAKPAETTPPAAEAPKAEESRPADAPPPPAAEAPKAEEAKPADAPAPAEATPPPPTDTPKA
jgi:hypothetical protein